MKKIFAFAMAVVSMAAVMTSCSNDDSDFVMQSAPTRATVENQNTTEKKDVSLVVAVTPEQKNYYDDTYTVQISGKTQTVMVSEMEPATKEEIEALKNAMEIAGAFSSEDDPVELEFYSIQLGQVTTTFSSKIQSRELVAKDSHPTEQFNFMNAACLCFNGQMAYDSNLDIRLIKGVYSDDTNLKGFADKLNQYNK